MNLLFRIYLNLILVLTMHTYGDSTPAMAQERPAYEAENNTIAQVSLEEVVSLDESEIQAPRLIFRPGDPAKIDRQDESYELHFETIQDGSGQKRILLSVPTSVVEIEITQRTKPGVNAAKSAAELDRASLPTAEGSSSELRLVKNEATGSELKLSGGLKMVPAQETVKGRIKNPYFLGVEPETAQHTKVYASTGHERIKESHGDNRLESDTYYKKRSEKPNPTIQVRFSDLNDK
jgi:hypothetical protein